MARPVGRPPKEDPTQRFTVRIKKSDLAELDGWIARRGEEGLNRQGAMVRLIMSGISDVDKSPAISDVANSTVEAPTQPSPLDKLTPEHRAALELLLAQNRLAAVLEK